MNSWIQGLVATIAAIFSRKPKANGLEESMAKMRQAAKTFLDEPSKVSADSPGWEKLAGDLGVNVQKPSAKLESDQIVAYFELREASQEFAKHCEVTPEGNVLPPTEDTDKRIVKLQTAAIAYASAVREGLKAGTLAEVCPCRSCALFRLAALAYGNCPLGVDPSFVAAAFVNLMQAVKLLVPTGAIPVFQTIIVNKPSVNASTPFSHN